MGFSLAGIVILCAMVGGGTFYYQRSRHFKQIFKRSWAIEAADISTFRTVTEKIQTPVLQEAKQHGGHGTHPRKRLKRMVLVCLPVCLSVGLPVCLSACLSVCCVQ